MNEDIRHKEIAQSHFDRWAKVYDRGQITHWLRTFQMRTIDSINPMPHYNILDVGCGTGWAVHQLGRILSEGKACGVDLAPAMIETARTNSAETGNVEFKVGDSENIPYGDELFDIVMCSSSFHHYPNPVRALSEFHRVLKPSGRAYIFDTCRDGSVLVRLYDLGHRIFGGGHIRYYRTEEIQGFMKSAGFINIIEEFRVQKMFLHKKLLTSVTLMSAKK